MTIFHHVFLLEMEDIAQSVNDTGLYSLEFEPHGRQCIASLRYWKSDHLVKVQLCRYSLATNSSRNHLLVVTRILSFLSTAGQIVCMSGCTSEVIQSIEQSNLLKKGVEYPFRSKACHCRSSCINVKEVCLAE